MIGENHSVDILHGSLSLQPRALGVETMKRVSEKEAGGVSCKNTCSVFQ